MAITETMQKMLKPGAEEEDIVTRTIEAGTALVPSSLFLGLALGSIGVALSFQLTGRKQWANFVGQWAPTFLILGLYNKLVKQHGH